MWKWEISLTFLVQKEEDKGRKPTVVTKLLQKSEETVSAMAYMQDFVNGEDFCPFIKEPQSRKSGSITLEIFSN